MNNTLIRGLAVLEALAEAQQALGVTELAVRVGFPKSNVHRVLQTLVSAGYVRQLDAKGLYAASIRLWELGSAVLPGLDLRRIAQPFMEKLQAVSKQTVHLSVLDGQEVVYVHKIGGTQPLRDYTQIGGRAPAHCVATGQVLLAALPQSRLERISHELKEITPRAITDPSRFMTEMNRIKAQGYAINRGQWLEDLSGVAAAIRGTKGQVIASIGVSGPVAKLTPAKLRSLAPKVMEAAQGISFELNGAESLVRLW